MYSVGDYHEQSNFDVSEYMEYIIWYLSCCLLLVLLKGRKTKKCVVMFVVVVVVCCYVVVAVCDLAMNH